MASISYEMVKRQLKDHKEKPPDFPIACIFDFSNMYSTLHYYASDKILMRMKELTSLLEILRSSSIELDWSRCSIPSKFVHKDTKEPLFLIIPLFTRGITSFISKTETLELSKAIWEISQLIEKAGSSYIFFDLPEIDIMERDNSVIPALLNSNIVIGVVDCNKSTYAELTREIEIMQSLLSGLELVANPPLSLGGIILNQVTERALIGNWAEKVAEEYFLNIYGKIGEDPQFNKIIIKKEIPTIETHIRKLRCAKDLKSTAESINKALSETSLIRNVTEKQQNYLKERIFSL
jgi:hypothetical protein